MRRRFDLSDLEWSIIHPQLPTKLHALIDGRGRPQPPGLGPDQMADN